MRGGAANSTSSGGGVDPATTATAATPKTTCCWVRSGAAALYAQYLASNAGQKIHFIIGAFLILGAMLPRDAW